MESVLALDIGTRVVIGLLMIKTEDKGYEVLKSARTEHKQRAMYDGQVHDVGEVSKAVLRVKKELEDNTGEIIKKVAVAAAGRALRTQVATASREEVLPVSWEQEDILALEMEAVEKAMKKSEANDDGNSLYCVGYNTTSQLLEDQPLFSLLGQRGKKAELSVIATFLPRTVVDGLMAVLARSGLEMQSLTLEPIAAGEAAIPSDMRRMNLALIDIGAGTADIALTQNGTFFAYGMVPMAGDEVTEAICAQYLLDFAEGERIKKELLHNDIITIKNFFGEETQTAKDEILEIIKPTVRLMAERIGKEIVFLNKKPPQAVILIGGGSLTPLLDNYLAEVMEIPHNRVGIQVRERLADVFGDSELTGPEVITPIGIGITALQDKGLHYYYVKVNELSVPIFELSLATVAEALFGAGIQPRSFIGRPGSALTYELNGELKVIKGSMGEPAKIFVNDEPARLEQELAPGDCVRFIPGKPGCDAKARIKDIITLDSPKKVRLNGKEQVIQAKIFVNGKEAGSEDQLVDGCQIAVNTYEDLFSLLAANNYQPDELEERAVIINGKRFKIGSKLEIKVNGKIINENCIINNQDTIEVKSITTRVKDLNLQAQPIRFQVNGQDFSLPPNEIKILNYDDKELSQEDVLEHDMQLKVIGVQKKMILSDLFPYLSLTQNVKPGSKLHMAVNGEKAVYTTEIKANDIIEVQWV